VSAVYGTGTTENVAGVAIRTTRHFRIKSRCPIRIRIESRSFAGPYLLRLI